ncbi:cupredoxin domain-containing protein [Aromatoleum toluclasticum]|uniref:cupredoxin domain-containing protein n=1 Tax=Aromatoleum toluclasticum TaxID=92003 RepID=UPI000364D565|nr:cupredoxin family protein [Aromatoleum toluclasticum]
MPTFRFSARMNGLLLAAAAATLPLVASAHGTATHEAKIDDSVMREQQDWGVAGLRREAVRTITIRMDDRMRFTPERIEVREGETVRLVARNDGTTLHELVLGTRKTLVEHAELMKKFPDMEHDAPWMAHVPPGGTVEIVWTFNRPGPFEFACLIAGHFDAGMVGTIDVKPAARAQRAKNHAKAG